MEQSTAPSTAPSTAKRYFQLFCITKFNYVNHHRADGKRSKYAVSTTSSIASRGNLIVDHSLKESQILLSSYFIQFCFINLLVRVVSRSLYISRFHQRVLTMMIPTTTMLTQTSVEGCISQPFVRFSHHHRSLSNRIR